jgi:hypothetical protein
MEKDKHELHELPLPQLNKVYDNGWINKVITADELAILTNPDKNLEIIREYQSQISNTVNPDLITNYKDKRINGRLNLAFHLFRFIFGFNIGIIIFLALHLSSTKERLELLTEANTLQMRDINELTKPFSTPDWDFSNSITDKSVFEDLLWETLKTNGRDTGKIKLIKYDDYWELKFIEPDPNAYEISNYLNTYRLVKTIIIEDESSMIIHFRK